MNLGSHVTIAAAHYDDPLVRLGSALPDIATIGGFRMVPGSVNGPVGEGIAFHHKTDAIFHSHPWFTSRQKSVFDQLSTAGVGRGAARASAHVGVELLLDGEVFANDPDRSQLVSGAFAAARSAPDIAGAVPDESQELWRDHLASLHRWRAPGYFRDPLAVAHRMESILARRPRLAMSAGDVPKVASALEAAQPSIAATAEDFLREMVEALSR
ncbi:MAG: hypothetical protein HKN24_12150 [Acidimicrobiales bacterium]|nr:hypothetical protein [Acidimicrobiales bacterium]